MIENEVRGRLLAQAYWAEMEKIALSLAPFKSMAGHALLGAAPGAAIGAATAGEGNRTRGAIAGGALGAAAGAGVGHLGMRAFQRAGIRKGVLEGADDATRAAWKKDPTDLNKAIDARTKEVHGDKDFFSRWGYKPLVRGGEAPPASGA